MASAKNGHEGSWLYLLHCQGDRFYCGVCLDFTARWQQHVTGQGAKFTKAFPPQSLAAAWHIAAPLGTAQKMEYRLKRLSRSKKNVLVQQPRQVFSMLKMEPVEILVIENESTRSA